MTGLCSGMVELLIRVTYLTAWRVRLFTFLDAELFTNSIKVELIRIKERSVDVRIYAINLEMDLTDAIRCIEDRSTDGRNHRTHYAKRSSRCIRHLRQCLRTSLKKCSTILEDSEHLKTSGRNKFRTMFKNMEVTPINEDHVRCASKFRSYGKKVAGPGFKGPLMKLASAYAFCYISTSTSQLPSQVRSIILGYMHSLTLRRYRARRHRHGLRGIKFVHNLLQ